jgi:hypothetical protein
MLGEMQIMPTILQTLISVMIKVEIANIQDRAVGFRMHLEFTARRKRGNDYIPLKCTYCLTT